MGCSKSRLSCLIGVVPSIGLVLALAAATPVAAADEILESIKEAEEQYQQGEYGEAIDSLNFAIAKVREKQQGGLTTALPSALEGWKAEDTQGEYAGMALMGGGASVSRRYTKGGESVEVSFLTDSPLIQSMAALITNPMLASSDPNSTLTKIEGNKAIEKWETDNKSGEITMVLKNTMLVTIKGSGLAAIDPVRAYAKAIDYQKLKEFLAQ